MHLQYLLNSQSKNIASPTEFHATPIDHRVNTPENSALNHQQSTDRPSLRKAPIWVIWPAPAMATRPLLTSPLGESLSNEPTAKRPRADDYPIVGEPTVKRRRTDEHSAADDQPQEIRVLQMAMHGADSLPVPVNITVAPDQRAEQFRQLLVNEGPHHWLTRGDEFVAHWQAFYEKCGDWKFSRMTSEERETMMLAVRTFSEIRALQCRKLPRQRQLMDQSLINTCINNAKFMQSLIAAYDICVAKSKVARIKRPFIGMISKIRTINRELPHVSEAQRINLLNSLGLSQPEAI